MDVYGPGNDNFSLKLLPTAGELTIDTSEGTAYVKYPNPTWQDRRVDACLGFTGQCGEPAAQMFCKMMGYPAAVGAQGATDVGPQTTTITLDKKEICTGAHCRALSEITCSTKSMATLRSTGT